MFPFCEKSIPHQWECFRNQNYFALSAAAAAGLLLRVCSAGFASASFASAGRASAGCASAGCVPQALLHGHCFCGHCFCELCFCGFVPRFFRFAGANVGCSRPSGRQPNEDGGVRTAFRRRSGGVRVAFGCKRLPSDPFRRGVGFRTAGLPVDLREVPGNPFVAAVVLRY